MYIKGIIFFLFMVVLLLSCHSEQEKQPVYPFPEEKIIQILADVHLAEAKLSELTYLPQNQQDSIAKNYYFSIYRVHGLNAGEYNQLMNELSRNPDELNRIYDKVLIQLQTEESKIQG